MAVHTEAAGRTLTGRCACGAVQFKATGPWRPVIACHCESCRRQSGHIVAATAVAKSHFAITQGEEAVRWWRATDHASRGFCQICGSLLFWTDDDASAISIMAGSLDGPTGLHIAEHIHVSEKGDYYDIADGLPQKAIR